MGETKARRQSKAWRDSAGLGIKLATVDPRGTPPPEPGAWAETLKAAMTRWTDEEVDAAIAAAAAEEGR